MNNKTVLLHLSLIDGISSATIAQCITTKPAALDLADMYQMSAHDIAVQFGLAYEKGLAIEQGLASDVLLRQELDLIHAHDIAWATIVCPEYPALLKSVHLLPPVIYWQGALRDYGYKSIAFVGARKANGYAQQAIDMLVPELVARDYVIVSGGALGADSMAHKAAVQAGGKTMAVLGAGLLMPYLASHKKLMYDILSNDGAVISSFPLRTEAFPANFPARNRIIAGLSSGTVVVQAAEKSGALITARFALDQGREVFAVPGPIYDPLSAGCHALIQQGAKLVTTAADILGEFGELPEHSYVQQQIGEAKKPSSTVSRHGAQQEHDRKAGDNIFDATDPQSVIMRACYRPCSLDDLVQEVGLDMAEVQGMLFNLQLEGRLKQNFMGMWERA